MATSFSYLSRAQDLDALAAEPVDLLVIGGGVTGCGIARDAARRGIRTALVDQSDFAAGTSSRSSRLVHGGLRYLEQYQFRLVFEASRERRLLLRLAPHLVRPLPFLLPVFEGGRVPPWKLVAGLWLYDLLALFRNVRRHRWLGKRAVRRLEPELKEGGIRGGVVYYDAQCDDARLTLANARDARLAGALVANYAAVVGLEKAEGLVRGAVIRDVITGHELTARALQVVNATGPWSDQIRRLDDPSAQSIVRLTRGTHVAVKRERVGNRGAITLTSPIDGRVMFTLPWRHLTYIGTTDSDYDGAPDDVYPTGDDVTYLLRSVNALFPRARLGVEDIVTAWAGLRPLARPKDHVSASSVSREHLIEETPSTLLSVVGGKLTTYRAMAKEIVDRVVAGLKRRHGRADFGPCATHRVPLPGGEVEDLEVLARELGQRGASVDMAHHLVDAYGSEAAALLKLMEEDRSLERFLVPGLPLVRAEIRHAVRREMAMTLGDVMFRRLHLFHLAPDNAVEAAPAVAQELADALDWGQERVATEVQSYRAETDRRLAYRLQLPSRAELPSNPGG